MRVYYNGVILQRCLTKSWEETVEYDETGLNMIGSRITLTFEGTVMPRYAMAPYSFRNGDFVPSDARRTTRDDMYINHYANYPPTAQEGTINAGIQVSNNGTPFYMGHPVEVSSDPVAQINSFSQRLNVILRQLSMPRGALFVYGDVYQETAESEILFMAYGSEAQAEQWNPGNPAAKKHIDINGGPKPKNVSITEVFNEFARVSFTVEVFRIRCIGGDIENVLPGLANNANPANGFVVSNRCWTEETFDKNFYTTRTYSGKLRISSTEKSVHFYRHLYYPPLESGFRRESVRFAESEDGLTLSYVITDRQVRCSAPWPATEMSGNVTYDIQNASAITLKIDLTLIGSPDADKNLLADRAQYAVMKKIDSFLTIQNGTNYGGYQDRLTISENIGDPPSVSISTQYHLFGDVTASPTSSNATNVLLAQMIHGMSQIGQPIEFQDTIYYGGKEKKYNRFKSTLPNPYGYNVFSAYDSASEAAMNEAQKTGYLGFIKCLATSPCAFVEPTYRTGTVEASKFDELTETYVMQDPTGTTYTTQTTEAKTEAITQPFSFYKSDITYYTDQSRFVLPQARPAGASLGSRQEILGSIRQLQSTIDSLKAMDPYEEIPVNYFLTPSTETGDDNGGDEQPPVETIAVWELLEKNETELERQKNKLNNARIVQLARPVPKAVVTIEAERFGRLPEFPDPNEVVVTQWDEGCQDEPLYFTPLKFEVKLGEPRPGKNTTAAVSYNAVATYEYALSREYKKGDRVWLLHNPTFPSTCYFPRNNDGSIEPAALSTLFNGEGLNHGSLETQETPPEEQEDGTEPPNIDI